MKEYASDGSVGMSASYSYSAASSKTTVTAGASNEKGVRRYSTHTASEKTESAWENISKHRG